MVGSLGTSLAAWLLVPAVVYLLGAGIALLVERVARFELSNALLAPVGFLVAIALVMPGYRLGAGAWLAAPLVCLAALAGLMLARRDLRARLNPGWAGVAGLGVYALYLAPVILAGGWTWTGYNFVNDTAVQLVLADHLAGDGLTIPAGPPAEPVSTGVEHVRLYLEGAYPAGIHALLATVDVLVPAPLAAIYQPVVSLAAAFGAMALVPLGRRAGLPLAVAAGAAVAALGANLAYHYALQGNAKEVAVLASLPIAAAVAREALTSDRAVGGVAVAALCLAGSIALFSAAALPYVGMFALLLFAAAFFQRSAPLRRRLVPATVVGAAVLVVASVGTLVNIIDFGEAANANFGENGNEGGQFGQLLRPLRLAQTAGIWLVDDYRLPVDPSENGINKALILLAVAALVAGLAWLVRRRESGALLYLGTVVVALAVLEPRISPYATGKMLAIASPAVVFVAAIGLYATWTWSSRAGAWPGRIARTLPVLATVALAGGVIVSDAMAYRGVRLAPVDRMEALQDISERYAGDRFVLVDDFEEFAKVFMDDARENVALELVTPYPARNVLRESFQFLHADLDQMPLDYLNTFDVIVQRRGADSSRPPADFEKDYETRYYTGWVRRPGVRVREHLSLQALYTRTKAAPCAEVEAMAKRAGRGDRLVVARAREEVRLDPVEAGAPADWQPDANVPHVLRPLTPGRVEDELGFRGGTYRAWVVGSSGRDVEVRVDGRRVGAARGVNTPGEWLEVGTARIEPGIHRVELVRGGAGLGPGNRFIGVIGPIVFERIDGGGDAKLEWLRPSEAERLCGRELDWVELARRR